ncbi:hypothetical protein O7635_31825 [Asanoa sp. WMMD1127]|uniref:hypothetical protein n=1 Tax=Asanoa sp. WMMD1127 TaxID=3016107 RepID=UPI0024169272|nr:hypothetical protein [Asanoa sp. WMMD1127]MDG4826463.1 hypothetical protein [Asanoa sp. WMMD1127]
MTRTPVRRRVWPWIAGGVVVVLLAAAGFVVAAGGPRALGWGEVKVSGDGAGLVPVELDAGKAYVATVSHSGGGFSMTPRRDGVALVWGAVSHLGPYHGSVLFGVAEDPPAELDVSAQGSWEVVFREASEAPMIDGTASGTQETVVTLSAAARRKQQVVFDCDGCDQVTVRAVATDGVWRQLDTPSIPFTTAALPPDTEILEISAYGSWTLALT